KVSLDITSASEHSAQEIGPTLRGSMVEKVVGAKAAFVGLAVEWKKRLRKGGETAVVEATLSNVGRVVASTSFNVLIKPTKSPFEAKVYLNGNRHWGSLETFTAGDRISGLHLRLVDQQGNEVTVDEVTCETVTCTWKDDWRWQECCADKSLPDLLIPQHVSGKTISTVRVTPKAIGDRVVTSLEATLEYAVVAGEFARWVAVKADTGKHSANPGPLEVAVGCNAKACLKAFKKIFLGFLPVDEYGNRVSRIQPAEVRIEGGSPEARLRPTSPLRLTNLTSASGMFRLPDGFRLEGPAGEITLVISNPAGARVENGALRLRVVMKSGPPVGVMIRSPVLGAEIFSGEITSKTPELQVLDLEVKLVDARGNEATLTEEGVKITVNGGSPLTMIEPRGIMPGFTLGVGREQSEDKATLVVQVEVPRSKNVLKARINWEREPTGAIIKLHIAAVTEAAPFSLERPANPNAGQRTELAVVRPVDVPLPTLVVWMETDDGSSVTPHQQSITLKISEEGSHISKTDLYKAPQLASETIRPHALVLKPNKPAGESMDQNVGKHLIECTYVETRAGQPLRTKTVKMTIHAVAGAPYKLGPCRKSMLSSLSASNAGRRDQRRLGKKFEFVALDCKDNRAVGITGPVRMRIEDVPGAEMPALENSIDGFVSAELTESGSFVFSGTALQAGVGSTEGTYRLLVDSEDDHHLKPCMATFEFVSDVAKAAAIRQAEMNLEPLKKKMELYTADLDEAKRKETEAVNHAKVEVGKLREGLIVKISKNEPGDCVVRILFQASKASSALWRKQVVSYARAKGEPHRIHRRAWVRHATTYIFIIPKSRCFDTYLYLVYNRYVENGRMARLVSQAAGTKMKGVYVKTKKQFVEVWKAKSCGLCEETIAPFVVKGNNGDRPRNPSEIAKRKLPLPEPTDVVGFKGYPVNMIDIPDDNEHLRDTLFWALFGNMIMIDTHINASAYQTRRSNTGESTLQILVQEDGSTIVSTR
ncbi:unnamed protein product, partial [Pylaiella littoralis]